MVLGQNDITFNGDSKQKQNSGNVEAKWENMKGKQISHLDAY